MKASEPSKFWPWFKGVARLLKHVKIPGTDLTFGTPIDALIGLQEDVARSKGEDDVRLALNTVRDHTTLIVEALRQQNIDVPFHGGQFDDELLALAERVYLADVAGEFRYLEFRGIAQDVRWVSVDLDDVFVDLKVRPERAEDREPAAEREFREAILAAEADERERLERQFEGQDALRALKLSKHAPASQPQPIDRLLAQPGGRVLLGGPGSGKTTLVKRLARSLALGEAAMSQRYPAMPPRLFPLVVPITLFNDWRQGDQGVLHYVEHHLREKGGKALLDVFQRRWGLGECLILLDGLDEVAHTDHRIASAKAADALYQDLAGNRALVTSRIVGYNFWRLAVPADHFLLEPLSRQDVETFCRQWHQAREREVHREAPNPDRARKDAQELIGEIHANPSVASLASNPLMLTIIALIKQRDVRLPQRRVELYEVAVNTLLRSWNNARSLSGRPLGGEPRLEQTKRVWAAVAHWMHQETSRLALHRRQLHERLVEVLIDDAEMTRHQAENEAESYLSTAAEVTGLLEARGPDTFAFMHQTFQEYLAADRLAIPTRRAAHRIMQVAHDPRWHEVIRLAAGIIGIFQWDQEALEELVDALLECDDPLEPFLCSRVRLAAACMGDDVGFRQVQIDRVLCRIVDRLMGLPTRWPVFQGLAEALRCLPFPQPERVSQEAVDALCWLGEHDHWRARMEAARKLALITAGHQQVAPALERLFEDKDPDVKAHAAVGLWRAGQSLDTWLLRAVARGLASSYAGMSLTPQPVLVPGMLGLLEDAEAYVRLSAASVLGGWGHQEEAVPALLGLLQHADALLRLRAARVLGRWGPQEEAVPAMLRLLQHSDADVRSHAAEVLRGWGPQEEALPALLALLDDAGAYVRFFAAETLGSWGHQEEAVPALLGLLVDAEAWLRFFAAKVLGDWGHQEEALPALLALLQHARAYVRLTAADVLGIWAHQEALRALLGLLEDPDAGVRWRAAEALGGWGHQEEAVPTLLGLLEDADADVPLRAAEVLGGWGGGGGGAKAVLGALGMDEHEPVVQFLAACGEESPQAPPPDVAAALAKILTPQPDDSPGDQARRDVVFRWLWKAAQTS